MFSIEGSTPAGLVSLSNYKLKSSAFVPQIAAFVPQFVGSVSLYVYPRRPEVLDPNRGPIQFDHGVSLIVSSRPVNPLHFAAFSSDFQVALPSSEAATSRSEAALPSSEAAPYLSEAARFSSRISRFQLPIYFFFRLRFMICF